MNTATKTIPAPRGAARAAQHRVPITEDALEQREVHLLSTGGQLRPHGRHCDCRPCAIAAALVLA